MPNRILKESICSSDNVDLLTAEEERLFTRLITRCDDYGCFDARPALLRAECFPLKTDAISAETMARWTVALARAGLIRLYLVGTRPYLQMVTWERHQGKPRANKPKHPLPAAGRPLALDRAFAHLYIPASNCSQVPADDRNGPDMSSYPDPDSYPVTGDAPHMPAGVTATSPAENHDRHDDVTVTSPTRHKATSVASESSAPDGAPSPDPVFDTSLYAKYVERWKGESATKKTGALRDILVEVFGHKLSHDETGHLVAVARDFGAGEVIKAALANVAVWNGADDPVKYLNAILRDRKASRRNGIAAVPRYWEDGPDYEAHKREQEAQQRKYGVSV